MSRVPCGTYAAYQRHLRRKEAPCADCRRANREYHRAHRASHPERIDRERGYTASYNRALARLVGLYPDVFDALLAEEREAAS